ncbi:RICIN domain-containing protein [Streptomyces sp. NPDC021080]|uniref:RICIN domain-containing protein n=1 Tax=Streptomyces sp. NPDC021080 TaxID=3365110 RepID=UPI0037A860DD
MRALRIRNSVAAVLAGALMAVVSPAIAQAESLQSGTPTPSVGALGSGSTSLIKNLKSGKYLTAASSANGAKVTQQADNGSYLQRWYSVLTEAGTWYSFENYQSGLNLGIDGASTAVGSVAITANGSSDLNQDWEKDWDGDYFALVNRKSGLCLGISGASTASGAAAAQFKCDGSANQHWTLVD